MLTPIGVGTPSPTPHTHTPSWVTPLNRRHACACTRGWESHLCGWTARSAACRRRWSPRRTRSAADWAVWLWWSLCAALRRSATPPPTDWAGRWAPTQSPAPATQTRVQEKSCRFYAVYVNISVLQRRPTVHVYTIYAVRAGISTVAPCVLGCGRLPSCSGTWLCGVAGLGKWRPSPPLGPTLPSSPARPSRLDRPMGSSRSPGSTGGGWCLQQRRTEHCRGRTKKEEEEEDMKLKN